MSRLTDRQIDTVDRTDRQEVHTDTAHLIEKTNMEQNELRLIALPAVSNSLRVNVMRVPSLSRVNAAARNSLCSSLKQPPGGVSEDSVCSHRDTEEEREWEREKERCLLLQVRPVRPMSEPGSVLPSCVSLFPSKHDRFVDSVGGGEKEGGRSLPVYGPASCPEFVRFNPDQSVTRVTFSYRTFPSVSRPTSRPGLTSLTSRLSPSPSPSLSPFLSPCLCPPARSDRPGPSARRLAPTCCPPCCRRGACPRRWMR